MSNNIILQHFAGELRDLDKLSIENIQKYAERIGVKYELVLGFPFRENLTPPCQKVVLVDEKYDSYDKVLMLDIDMFATKDLQTNVFEDEPGIGLFVQTQMDLRNRLAAYGRIPLNGAYWGGSFYLMDKETRVKLRSLIPTNDDWMRLYNQPYHYEDEGIISELYNKAGLPAKNIKRKWCQCSFLPELEEGFIHIRTKITPTGPKRTKMENYLGLVEKGIL